MARYIKPETLVKERIAMRRVILFASIGAGLLILFAVSFLLLVTLRVQKQLVNKEPNYTAEELYSRAVEQTDKGDYSQAEAYLEAALIKEEDSSFRNQLAVVKYRLKKYEESIEQYKKLVDDGRDAAFAWNGIGNAYRDWGVSYEADAIDAYRKAISLNSGYVAAYSNLALLYVSQGKKSDALTVLDEGISATASPELQTVKSTISGQ